MSKWKNFTIWRARLPHWRADDVTYFVTFRHRRELSESERRILIKHLMRPEGKRWDLLMITILPEVTEMLVRMIEMPTGRPFELSDVVEKAKIKAGKLIIKNSGERFPPFYTESFDRIVRDDEELNERWTAILEGAVNLELCEEPEDYEFLWVADAPDGIDIAD